MIPEQKQTSSIQPVSLLDHWQHKQEVCTWDYLKYYKAIQFLHMKIKPGIPKSAARQMTLFF